MNFWFQVSPLFRVFWWSGKSLGGNCPSEKKWSDKNRNTIFSESGVRIFIGGWSSGKFSGVHRPRMLLDFGVDSCNASLWPTINKYFRKKIRPQSSQRGVSLAKMYSLPRKWKRGIVYPLSAATVTIVNSPARKMFPASQVTNKIILRGNGALKLLFFVSK